LKNIDLTVGSGELVLLCGGTGCGKTTLLRLIKNSIAPHGKREGEIFVFGKNISGMDIRTEAETVGMVMQRPESQIVSENTLDELAFGLASLSVPTSVIHRRIAEVSGYFGIDSWADKPINELSGGQKQILNLASVIAMQPEIILLDEPTSRLDPISASDFISAVTRLNRETGMTVVIAEHRVEALFPICDRVVFMRDGSVAVDEKPEKAASILASDSFSRAFLPPSARIFSSVGGTTDIPLTVKAARDSLASLIGSNSPKTALPEKETPQSGLLLKAEGLWFRYEKNSKDVLAGAEIELSKGEVLTVMGGNAAGKTTLVKCLAGLIKPYDGKLLFKGKKISSYPKQELYGRSVAYLPQDVNAVFTCTTVADELASVGIKREDIPDSLQKYAGTHPYDLSGGEQQKCAVAKLIAKRPELLILDEPTKGLDPTAVSELADTVKELSSNGMAIICVTHDAEFASAVSDSIVLMFGGICCEKLAPERFFAENSFYTTAAARITRGIADGIVTTQRLVSLLSETEAKR